MKTTELSPNHRELDRPTDRPDVDRLLSDFFKSELPDPFPPLKLSAQAELPMPMATLETSRERRTNNIKAKLSIAVSVALLIGGCWYLSGRMSDAPAQTKIGKGIDNAKMPKELKKAMR
jgi:hypothetical protein